MQKKLYDFRISKVMVVCINTCTSICNFQSYSKIDLSRTDFIISTAYLLRISGSFPTSAILKLCYHWSERQFQRIGTSYCVRNLSTAFVRGEAILRACEPEPRAARREPLFATLKRFPPKNPKQLCLTYKQRFNDLPIWPDRLKLWSNVPFFIAVFFSPVSVVPTSQNVARC